jgi:hypothetical protein
MVNFTPGENIANQGAVMTWNDTPANPDIRIYASAPTHVVVDVVGYWYPATNEIDGGSFQAGGGPPSTFYDPQAGPANLKFLAPPATVTVGDPAQIVIVNSSRAFGTWWDEANGLVLGICFENLGVPGAQIQAVGPGMGAAPGNDIRVRGQQTVPMALNAAFAVPAGVYDVGLCGFVRGGFDPNRWDRNDDGYTTAFVILP